MLRLYIALLFICWTILSAFGQDYTIKGRITDYDTEEGLPFCNVFIQGTTTGVSTDVDGYFTLTTSTKGDSLVASAIGYQNRSKAINANLEEQMINFSLRSSDFTLSEVVIIAGENPANEIVRNIIKNKNQNRVEALDAYQCEAYNKVELDLDNIDEKFRQRKVFKPFEFIFENIDSTSDERPFLPAYISEKISDVYYLKDQKPARVIPRAQRVSGIDNQTVVTLIERIHDEFSIYDNWIYVLEKPFISPFANQGLFYYEYYIIDSTYIQGQWSYKLKFKPKRKQENTFYGDFWVADTTFAIERVNMRMSPDVNINLVRRIIIYQEFNLHEVGHWLPTKQKMVVDFIQNKKSPGIIGRKTASFSDYRINYEEVPDVFDEEPVEFYNTDELKRDDSYWDDARHEELTANEEAVYKMVDSIKNVPIYKTYVDVIYTLVSGYKEFGPVEVGPYFSVFNNNPVEGNRIKLGVWTSNNFSKTIRFGGYMAY
ncbi:MAG: DUF5686 family protein, partial [Bacteroidota bacterium]